MRLILPSGMNRCAAKRAGISTQTAKISNTNGLRISASIHGSIRTL